MLQYDLVRLDDRLAFAEETVAILARDVRQLRSKIISMVKVQWHHRPIDEATWELEIEMQQHI